MRLPLLTFVVLVLGCLSSLQAQHQDPAYNQFEQLYDKLPTPNTYRTASGAPGHAYYQQQADYIIKLALDDANQTIRGEETITYHNNSPDPLTYLWVQLDQNMRAKDSDTYKTRTMELDERMSFSQIMRGDDETYSAH